MSKKYFFSALCFGIAMNIQVCTAAGQEDDTAMQVVKKCTKEILRTTLKAVGTIRSSPFYIDGIDKAKNLGIAMFNQDAGRIIGWGIIAVAGTGAVFYTLKSMFSLAKGLAACTLLAIIGVAILKTQKKP